MANLYTVSRVLAVILATVLQLHIIESQLFDSEYTMHDMMLRGHVFETYTGITSYFDCYVKCESCESCYSLNYHPTPGLCELSYTCHLSYPNDTVPAPHVTYLMVRECFGPPCSWGKFMHNGAIINPIRPGLFFLLGWG